MNRRGRRGRGGMLWGYSAAPSAPSAVNTKPQRTRSADAAHRAHRAADDDGDVVGAAALEGELDERVADLLARFHRREVVRDLLVGDVLREAVGADEDDGAALAHVDARHL